MYGFWQDLLRLRQKRFTKRECRAIIPEYLWMIEELKKTPFKYLQRLGRTLKSWKKEILNYFLSRLTNARTEGFNNVAKLVQKRA